MRIDAYNQISQIYQTTERRTVGKKILYMEATR